MEPFSLSLYRIMSFAEGIISLPLSDLYVFWVFSSCLLASGLALHCRVQGQQGERASGYIPGQRGNVLRGPLAVDVSLVALPCSVCAGF